MIVCNFTNLVLHRGCVPQTFSRFSEQLFSRMPMRNLLVLLLARHTADKFTSVVRLLVQSGGKILLFQLNFLITEVFFPVIGITAIHM